jgi:peptidoglycan/LPS O-acetylase OafA/YrhL
MAAGERRAYQTLDGLRGVGAFVVVMRHVPYLFGPVRVPESFLAVDLFYLVSGFVVAHAYGERLKAGGFFKDFVKTRLIRLYPLYLFGLAVGILPATYAVVTDPHGWWNLNKLLEAIFLGLFMVPMMPGLQATGTALDGPIWTLVPELIANFTYAAIVRHLKPLVLAAILIVCGAAVAYGEMRFKTLDIGYNPTDQWAALARVGYSFFAGVVVFRVVGDRRIDSEPLSWICMALLTAILIFRPSTAFTPWFEIGAVVVAFPLIIAAAAQIEPGPVTGRAFAVIGLVSYAVYLLHQPMGNIARIILGRLHVHIPADWHGLLFGAVFMAAVFGLSWWLDSHYDAPVRAWLRARFMPPKAKAGQPAPQPGVA